jgi:hypothetical protein
MTIEELKALVPEDKREELVALMKDVETKANPLAGMDESNADAYIEKIPALKSARDRFHNRGLETWQKNNLDKLYAERYAKENPEESEADKRIRALEIANQEAERRAVRAENAGIAQRLLTERKLPLDLLDYVIADDAEATKAKVERIVGTLESYGTTLVEAKQNEILAQYGRLPDAPTNGGGQKFLTEAQILAMSAEEMESQRPLVDASIKALEKQEQMR